MQSMMSHAKGLKEESLFHPLLKCLLGQVVSMTIGQSKETLCHIVAGFIMPDLWKVARLQGNYDTPEVVCMCLFITLNHFKCSVILMKIKDNHFQHKRTAPKLSFQSLHTCMYIM